MTWSVVPQRSTIASGRYEAFPSAVRLDSGRVVAMWSSQVDHYVGDATRVVWSDDEGVTWSAPVTMPAVPDGTPGAVALAARGSRLVALLSRGPDIAAFATWSDDGGATWSAPVRVTPTDTWYFPSGLAWVEDGSASGVLLATTYNDAGVRVYHSLDRGVTWALRSQMTSAPWSSAENETRILQLPEGVLLAASRVDGPSGTPEVDQRIVMRRSTDYGMSWGSPSTAVRTASGLPTMTRMADGSILMTIRRTSADTLPWSWGLALSDDDGWSWRTIPVSDEMMMYGQVVQLGDQESGLLVGADQPRGQTALADVWSRRLSWNPIHMQSVIASRPAPSLDVYVSGLPADTVAASVSRTWRGRSVTLLVADAARGTELRVVDHAMPVAAPPALPPKIRVGYEVVHLGDGLYEFIAPDGYDDLVVTHDGSGGYLLSTVNGDPVDMTRAQDGLITAVERVVQPPAVPELIRYTLEVVTSGGSIVRTLDVPPALVGDSDVWLSDPLDPRGAVLVTAMATDGEGMSWDSDGGVIAPMGGLAISTGQRRTRVRGWRLETEDPAAYAGLVAMIDRGAVLLLRGDPDCLDHPDGVVYAHVESPRWGHVLPHSPHRWLTFTGREVAAPLASTIVAARSYGQDFEEHASYADSLAALPTYLDRVRA